MSSPNQPDASAASAPDTRSHKRIIDLVRAFYEPFRTGDTATYSEILARNWVESLWHPSVKASGCALRSVIQGVRSGSARTS